MCPMQWLNDGQGSQRVIVLVDRLLFDKIYEKTNIVAGK